MIQDASPMRSGVPDLYVALYKIDIVSSGVTHNVNLERFPSGFGGILPGSQQAFVSAGRMDVSFPIGMKVRGANVNVDAKAVTAAGQVLAWVDNINEALGTASIITTLNSAPTVLANPPTNSVVYLELDLETV